MTPKEKAIKLINKFAPYCNFKSHYDDSIDMDMRLRYAKGCALAAVDEILSNDNLCTELFIYYSQVKREIENYEANTQIQ